ncbi:MAG: hypothetical protein M3437_13980 [Chloroflexota bacterium]|nr:hypothetical protein [Chloroflexota bacterium]MDQ5864471.1 hypothetical protein [Chloroflexota bacterium]
MSHIDLRTVDQKTLALAIKRCLVDTFDAEKWHELGFITGTSEIISAHPRLLRSLFFGDNDYSQSVTSVLQQIIEDDSNNLNIIADFANLGDWLQEKSPTLYTKWFGRNNDPDANSLNSTEGEIRDLATGSRASLHIYTPVDIIDSLQRFKQEHPNPRKVAFIMMQFGKTSAHEHIVTAVRTSLAKQGITALRADDKQYHDDLLPNIITYMYGCGFGIAVFERLESELFNPNVSLEVGYMLALGKSVCILRDRTLKTLPTDLISKLYKTFDPQDPIGTIPAELEKWLGDKGLV